MADTLDDEHLDSVPVMVAVEDTVLDADWERERVCERVTVPVEEWEEDPETEALPQALGVADTLLELHLDSVPLTVGVEETVVVEDWEMEAVPERVTVPVADREADPVVDALPQVLGDDDTLAVVHMDCVPLTVNVEESVVVVDWETVMVRERVTVSVGVGEEGPDKEGLPDTLADAVAHTVALAVMDTEEQGESVGVEVVEREGVPVAAGVLEVVKVAESKGVREGVEEVEKEGEKVREGVEESVGEALTEEEEEVEREGVPMGVVEWDAVGVGLMDRVPLCVGLRVGEGGLEGVVVRQKVGVCEVDPVVLADGEGLREEECDGEEVEDRHSVPD